MTMLYRECFPEDLEAMENSDKWVSMRKVDGDNFKIHLNKIQFNGSSKRVVKLINRHDNDYTRQFPEIVAGFRSRKSVNVILNGEIAYWDEEKGIYDFGILRGRQGVQKERKIMQRRLQYPCKFYVFDLINYDGISMVNNPDYPFERRYEILKRIVVPNNVVELLPIRSDLKQHFKEEVEAGREGIMVKSKHNIYANERTKSVLKCKNWKFSNVMFSGFEDNKAGITCFNSDGDRVLVAGENSELVRAMIIQSGNAVLKVRHLQDRTENGKMREPTYKELVVEV